MSDAVERVARALFIKGGPYHPQTELQSARDRARALLAEITPLLVAEAVKAEREQIIGLICDSDADLKVRKALAAAIRARGGEG